jgi:hypothetical protein
VRAEAGLRADIPAQGGHDNLLGGQDSLLVGADGGLRLILGGVADGSGPDADADAAGVLAGP